MIRALTIALLVLACASPLAAQDPPPKVTLDPLWGSHYRPGRFVPVAVTVEPVAGRFDDRIELRVDGGPTVVLELRISAGSFGFEIVSALAHGSGPSIEARIGATPGTVAASVPLRRPARAVSLIGVVAGPAGGGGPAVSFLTAPSRAVATYGATRLPRQHHWYDLLDTLVLGSVGTERLGDEEANAVARWARAGGRLLLTDPDLLRRVPALDRALFRPVAPDEDLPALIPGLPAHSASALRRRGLGVVDVVYDERSRPHHVRFRLGLGEGALLLSALSDAAAATAYEALLGDLGRSDAESVPTLAPRIVGSFAGPAPGGWARWVLAILLLLTPLLAWRPRRRPWTLGSAGLAAIFATGLAWIATAPVAEIVPIVPAAGGGLERGHAWVVHVASTRAAECRMQVDPEALVRPLLQHLGESGNPQGRWHHATRELQAIPLRAGDRGGWEVLGPPVWTPRLTGALAAGRLLVSNESGLALQECLLAWRGRLFDVGPIPVGGVRSVRLPDWMAGPLATLRAVADRSGRAAARSLAVARLRLSAASPTLLTVVAGPLLRTPTIGGASVTVLPTVLQATLEAR